MKWLYRIVSMLYGCRHKWSVIQTIKVLEFEGSKIPCEHKLIMKCTKCGDIKKKTV